MNGTYKKKKRKREREAGMERWMKEKMRGKTKGGSPFDVAG